MPDIAYMGLFYSGGAANTAPLLSLGGAMSTVRHTSGGRIIGQECGAFAFNQGSVFHCFRFDAAEQMLLASRDNDVNWIDGGAGAARFTSLGNLYVSPADTPVAINRVRIGEGAGMGTCEIDDGSYVVVRRLDGDVDWPTNDFGANAPVSLNRENIFDNVASSDAWNGLIDYRMVYLANQARNGSDLQLPITPGQRFTKVKLWVDAQPGSAQIAMGWNPLEINTEPTTLADRFTAPAGITFQDYDAETNAIELPVLDGLDQQPIWIRRTVFPMQSAGDITDDFFDIMWSAIG